MELAKLFDTNGINPINHHLIAQKAFDIKVKLSHLGFEVIGARGNFHMKSWSSLPKISLKGTSGKKMIEINQPKSAKASQSLISLLYSLCYLSDAKKGARLFYEDKQGIANSIASKHGPEKSAYMKGLISVLDDPKFIQNLENEITKPLPDNLTKLQLEIISKSESGVLNKDVLMDIMKNSDISCKKIEEAIDDLRVHPDLDKHRIPSKLVWPTMSICEHQDEIENKVNLALKTSKSEIESLVKQLEITKDKLLHTEEYNARLLGRGIWSRIRNKVDL